MKTDVSITNVTFCFLFSFYRGTSGIDIDLRAIDINQCPESTNSTAAGNKEHNIFAGSDKCHRPSQQVRKQTYIKFMKSSSR